MDARTIGRRFIMVYRLKEMNEDATGPSRWTGNGDEEQARRWKGRGRRTEEVLRKWNKGVSRSERGINIMETTKKTGLFLSGGSVENAPGVNGIKR